MHFSIELDNKFSERKTKFVREYFIKKVDKNNKMPNPKKAIGIKIMFLINGKSLLLEMKIEVIKIANKKVDDKIITKVKNNSKI
ncbi:hypothetical protein [Mesomycoplasma hyopneumoniae]|uniref:hypothetical protein n=1 Tax=Mesomycoplasma hyopneumoniae TaxID=2099 RepID=UPI0003F7B497|nr:hypothetical protein [Mesomycoplasma hyopneumoniae]